ncbi:MAG: hypothetical protein ACI4E0_04670 [Blautia sp.]
MKRLTVNKPVLEMTMVELAHNSCFAKHGEAFYTDFDSEISARNFARELAKNFGYEYSEDNEDFDYEVMDDLPIDKIFEVRELVALFYRNLWAQADLYEYLKKYEDTGLMPEQIHEIDKLYAEKCKELAEEKKKNKWIPADKPPEVNEDGESDYILLSFDNFTIPCVGIYRQDEEGGAYYTDTGEESLASIGIFVNAWRPLPERYREENE